MTHHLDIFMSRKMLGLNGLTKSGVSVIFVSTAILKIWVRALVSRLNSITIIIINSISRCVTFSVFNITAHGFSYKFQIKCILCKIYFFIYYISRLLFKTITYLKLALSIRKFTDNGYVFLFFPQHYCRLIITDEITDSGSFNRLHSH